MLYISTKNSSNFQELAKLRARRAKNVITCQRALCAYVPRCFKCLRALHTNVSCASSAHVPCVLTCLTCQHALRACVLMCRRELQARVLTCLESLASHGLRDHVITCQHALPPQQVVDATFFSFPIIVVGGILFNYWDLLVS